jgi:predicted transcriptional regulator
MRKKKILISIQPQWVEMILNGEKTIEIRKTRPNCELPIKVLIYQTKKKFIYRILQWLGLWQGKVVAEFTLNGVVKFNIESIMFLGKQQELMQKSKLGGLSLRKYLGNGVGYAWHIEDLIIYDTPKELSEFGLTKAPQSWRYIKE